ncbi:MAG: Ni/Fe hydrogenase subunit alpha [Actinomycetota bacterium]|jgi:coenzyme F420-reducing hydrogenase alpha subunit|nr:Ni/Fe hydrogenase subunit alpha [Actinomycetota bacterium]
MSEVVRLPALKRIEGHGRISLFMDDDGRIADAHFDVTEFRGFERFLEDRMIWEMPLMTSRICGVCPVSHHLGAVKAVDAMFGVKIPRAAELLRELLHLAGLAQDHALHFFFLAGPDFLTGDGAGSRDILGLVAGNPKMATDAIALRKAGQRIVQIVGGRSSHPVAAIPGGMSKGITQTERIEMLGLARGVLPTAIDAAATARDAVRRLLETHQGYGFAPMPMMAQMSQDRTFNVYDGTIEVMGEDGSLLERFDATEYMDHIQEKTLSNSYAKSPYLTSRGPETGSYRVGPLARINMSDFMGGPRADGLLDEFHREFGRPFHGILAYHWARMIELVASVERMVALLEDDEIISDVTRVKVERGGGVGIAAIEAPRGTLIHHYEADDVGRVTKANLIVATTNNTASLNASVLEVVSGMDRDEAMSQDSVRKMELGIRAHDPCLSCATHDIGKMPLTVEVIGPDGTVHGVRGVE